MWFRNLQQKLHQNPGRNTVEPPIDDTPEDEIDETKDLEEQQDLTEDQFDDDQLDELL